MKWRKLGLVYAPHGGRWWARKYALLPTAVARGDDVIRVYFSSLDDRMFGRVGYVDLDARDPLQKVFELPEPVLDIGELGAFDDSGVNPSCVLEVDGETRMYYIGWQRCERVPYMLYGGLAASTDGGQLFTRVSRTPVFDRTPDEPFSRGAPYVLKETDCFRAWYWSCEKWSERDGKAHYYNVIRHARSSDGKVWKADVEPCVQPDRENDYSVGRPWVIAEGGFYRMWYSIRSFGKITYRIGYAESRDGIEWDRKDEEAGIDVSESGWDSEMVCYPCVVDAADRRYMFYNGNRHGATGFGCAVLDD